MLNVIRKLFFNSTHKFWIFRKRYLGARSKYLKRYYLLRCSRILKKFNADISVTDDILPFETPHGLTGIFVSGLASVGENCTIYQHVTIGSNRLPESPHYGAPQIGNDVFIGAGAVLIGNITIGDHVRIGVNAAVAVDVPSGSTVVSQKPRILSREDEKKASLLTIRLSQNKYMKLPKSIFCHG